MIKKYYNIEINGNQEFVDKTLEALRLIRKKSNKDFIRANKYLKVIKTGRKSRILLEKSIFVVGKRVWNTEIEWYASSIVHEVCHYYLYHIKKIPWKKGNMKYHEYTCIKDQTRFLRKIGAPKRLVDWCEGTFKMKHWYRRKTQKY